MRAVRVNQKIKVTGCKTKTINWKMVKNFSRTERSCRVDKIVWLFEFDLTWQWEISKGILVTFAHGVITFQLRTSGVRVSPSHKTQTHTHSQPDLHTALATLCSSWPAANCETPNQLTLQQSALSHWQKMITVLYLTHSYEKHINYCTCHTHTTLLVLQSWTFEDET